MKLDLETAIGQLEQQIKSDRFVRAVLSGRRRKMQTEFERIDIKPVLIKEELKWQIISSCLLYTSPSPRDGLLSRMPSSA